MQEIINRIQEKFRNEINHKLDKKHVVSSPNSTISHSFNLLHFTNELIGIIPEILSGYVGGGKFREEVILKNADKCLSLKDRNAVLICHALSPYSESIGFYCDLGRAYRVSTALSLPIKVMLAGRQWANFNWVVSDLKLKNNLPKNEEWRIKVYKTLFDIEPDVFSVDDVKRDFGVDVHTEANDYVNLIIKTFGEEVINKKLSDAEVDAILSSENYLFDLAQLSILKAEIQPIKTVIECVLRNFNRADEETFTYFLTQYYHQSRYNGCIKLSMKREKDFDDSFREIYKASKDSKINYDNLIGLYLEDYKYGIKDDIQLTVHPYYFPSGSLYGIYKDDLKSEINRCIMINDFNDKDKIKEILSNLNYFQRARILSDILSFGHLLTLKFENFRHILGKWFKSNTSNYYYYSWDSFTNKDRLSDVPEFINDWTELIFTTWANHDNFPVPYWFLPFFWDSGNVSDNLTVSIDLQVDLVQIILAEAHRQLGTPKIVIDPINGGKYSKSNDKK